ncbi:MAG: hypothetical protein AUI47_03370 [Acidobacteria bacterium 13_1_40CM_2_68_5]|nr:MAG: hypothetical protein AUI47_03370 [Acidobacteria bacterium 13_1_40CM_2_68_5]
MNRQHHEAVSQHFAEVALQREVKTGVETEHQGEPGRDAPTLQPGGERQAAAAESQPVDDKQRDGNQVRPPER